MRPTIVFLEQQSWPGGAQRVLEATLDSVEREYERIVAFPDKGPFRSTLEERGIETLTLPVGIYRPGRKSPFEMIGFAWRSLYCGMKLAAFIRKRKATLVYINGPRCMPAGVVAAWLTRKPAIFHLHLILSRKLEVILVSRLARYVSEILACSCAASASLLNRDRRLAQKTHIVYNPSAKPFDHLSRREGYSRVSLPERFTIGIVGRITRNKGHHLLLRALGKLPIEIRKDIQVLVVGSEEPGCLPDVRYAQFLKTEATRLGLEKQVLWAGFQSDPWPYFASMDVLVHPSIAEAMCLVILEALQCGIPVIAAGTGGTPEVIQDGFNGLLVPPEDEAALSQALALFVQDNDVRQRLLAGARCGLDQRFSVGTFSSRIRDAIGLACTAKD